MALHLQYSFERQSLDSPTMEIANFLMLATEFKLTDDDVAFFKKHGFIRLKKIFSDATVERMQKLCKPAVVPPAGHYGAGFSKLKYDIGNDDSYILDLMQDRGFAQVLHDLTGQNLFFTQGLGFELEKNKSTGFPWHVGTQSFGFQHIDDYGCTLWTPLTKISTRGQRGGMAYVPTDVLSGAFVYEHINMLPEFIRAKLEEGATYEFKDFSNLKNNLLNSPEMTELLNYFSLEDDFELGDTFLFDKYVIHRSVKLEDGLIDSRLAYAMRFSSIEAKYDKNRVSALEYPRRLFNYDVSSAFNDEVCSVDGESVFESKYFGESRGKRAIPVPVE